MTDHNQLDDYPIKISQHIIDGFKQSLIMYSDNHANGASELFETIINDYQDAIQQEEKNEKINQYMAILAHYGLTQTEITTFINDIKEYFAQIEVNLNYSSTLRYNLTYAKETVDILKDQKSVELAKFRGQIEGIKIQLEQDPDNQSLRSQLKSSEEEYDKARKSAEIEIENATSQKEAAIVFHKKAVADLEELKQSQKQSFLTKLEFTLSSITSKPNFSINAEQNPNQEYELLKSSETLQNDLTKLASSRNTRGANELANILPGIQSITVMLNVKKSDIDFKAIAEMLGKLIDYLKSKQNSKSKLIPSAIEKIAEFKQSIDNHLLQLNTATLQSPLNKGEPPLPPLIESNLNVIKDHLNALPLTMIESMKGYTAIAAMTHHLSNYNYAAINDQVDEWVEKRTQSNNAQRLRGQSPEPRAEWMESFLKTIQRNKSGEMDSATFKREIDSQFSKLTSVIEQALAISKREPTRAPTPTIAAKGPARTG